MCVCLHDIHEQKEEALNRKGKQYMLNTKKETNTFYMVLSKAVPKVPVTLTWVVVVAIVVVVEAVV